MMTKYQKRISGPLLDRFEIHIEVPRVDYEKLSEERLWESSAAIHERVQKARDIQRQRFVDGETDIVYNADLRLAGIRQFCKLDEMGESLVKAARLYWHVPVTAICAWLTPGAYSAWSSGAGKLARTIADLAGSESIQSVRLAEALQYRPKLMFG